MVRKLRLFSGKTVVLHEVKQFMIFGERTWKAKVSTGDNPPYWKHIHYDKLHRPFFYYGPTPLLISDFRAS